MAQPQDNASPRDDVGYPSTRHLLPKQVAAPKTLAITATECANKLYHFTKDQAQEAGDAVRHFPQLLQAAKPSGKSGTYQKYQLEVIFRAPIEKAKTLALKVQGFHGTGAVA